MVVLINILLLAVLFVAGLVNLFIYFPTKKISSFLQSISLSNHHLPPRPDVVPTTTTTTSTVSSARKKVELKKVFGTFDKNNDGYITKKELIESLKNIRIFMSEEEVEEMIQGVDVNEDGLIDFEEFCVLGERLMVSKGKENENHDDHDHEDELKEAFAIFDKDKDGLISVDELGLVLSSLGLKEGKKIENCKEMIKKVDMDGDGMVNFDEFKKMMRSGASLLLAQS